MKWILIILFVSSVYTDARPKAPVKELKATKELAKPLEDLVPMLDEVTNKLTDLSQKIEKL